MTRNVIWYLTRTKAGYHKSKMLVGVGTYYIYYEILWNTFNPAPPPTQPSVNATTFRNMKYFWIVLIATRQFILFCYYFFKNVRKMEWLFTRIVMKAIVGEIPPSTTYDPNCFNISFVRALHRNIPHERLFFQQIFNN
jgi:hypothetical protein